MELTLEDFMMEKLSREMSTSIDFSILCDSLVTVGWTVVEVDYSHKQRWDDVMSWADENLVDDFQEHAGKWLIKDAKDAIMFKLRWA